MLSASQAADAASFTSLRRWVALIVLMLVGAVVALDMTLLNVALPEISRALHPSSSALPWIIDAYTVSFCATLLIWGAIGDRWGRSRLMAVGLAIFTAGSLIALDSSSTATLVAGRGVMGFGAAMLFPTTMAMVVALTDGAARSRAIAAFTAVMAVCTALGPIAGGYLVEHHGWRSVFSVTIPLTALALPLVLWLLPLIRLNHWQPIDWPGAIIGAMTLTSTLIAITNASGGGWGSTSVIIPLGIGVVGIAAFAVRMRRAHFPLIPRSIVGKRAFIGPSSAVTLANFGLNGGLYLLTLILQLKDGYSPLEAGIRTVPFALGIMIGGALSETVATRLGTRIVIAAGMLLSAVGITAFGLLDGSYPPMAGAMLATAIGAGLAMPTAATAILSAVPVDHAGTGSAIDETFQEVGAAFGVAVIASLAASGDLLLAHVPLATGIAGIVLAVGALSAFILTPTGVLNTSDHHPA
ncbi:MAG: MFS transporter [Thermomicrobiales bacterium]